MKEISLTQDKVALVDDEDFDKLNQFKWCANKIGNRYYAVRGSQVNKKSKSILMHREIMNTPKYLQVDHKDNDSLNNQKDNLRVCTNQQNNQNKKHSYKNNKCKIKGVCWDRNNKKFIAQIMINGKTKYLGGFNILGDADSAYRMAEEKYFGEFARVLSNV